MLKELSIQNFAIIDELKVSFEPGLNIITGETGAGKSILLGALGLVLGERADSSSLLNKEKKCTVEVLFHDDNHKLKEWLTEENIDADDELILRREINSNGKSRAFINDTPVNLSQLKAFTSMLVDLHQQFDTLELGEAYFQRDVLDAMAGCTKDAEAFHQLYLQYSKEQKELELLKQQQQQAQKEKDYNQFLLEELEQASFKENELEQIEQELKLLSNAGVVSSVLNEAVQLLKEGDAPLVQQLKSLLQRLAQYKELNASFNSVIERLQTAHIELSDIAGELDHLQNTISIDEERMQLINGRMEIGYKLQKKHGVHTTNELLQIQAQLQEKLQAVLNLEEEITAKEKAVNAFKTRLEKEADTLSAIRKKQALPFAQKINELLSRVGMPNATLKIEISNTLLNAYGKDEIEFLFDANKNNRFEPISKVASGGELSRLMLCIKSLVAKQMALPTMLFDEIDTGISGEAAKQVGVLLKELSQQHQVITITHLPQIAAKAASHFYVYKQQEKKGTSTKIRLLSKEEQIETVARMMSGDEVTESSLTAAREMVMN
ncbi:MAG: DNA repair protein RecN [Chitinophagaceae bacterium]|nr:DNA repair protein RecN [Chitinophagaceae bacterium]